METVANIGIFCRRLSFRIPNVEHFFFKGGLDLFKKIEAACLGNLILSVTSLGGYIHQMFLVCVPTIHLGFFVYH